MHAAVHEGMMRLREDGLEKVRRGLTSIAEIARVAGTRLGCRRASLRRAPPSAGPLVSPHSSGASNADAPGGMNFDFADILLKVVEHKASDLHITSGAPPTIRVRGSLVPLEGCRT